MENVIQEWVKASEYDLKTAEAMLETGRYLYVVFQSSINFILKLAIRENKAG